MKTIDNKIIKYQNNSLPRKMEFNGQDFISTAYCDNDGEVITRTYELKNNDKKSIYSNSKTIFDKYGQVISPIKTKNEPLDKVRILESRSITSETNPYKLLEGLDGQEIQLSLPRKRDLLYLDNKELRSALKEKNVKVKLMHGPDVDVFYKDFAAMIGWIRGNYGIDTLTLHPSRGNFENAMELFDEKSKELGGLGLNISYENINDKKRWLEYPQKISSVNHKFISSTLDISHLHTDTDLLDLMEKVFDKLRVVHLNNIKDGKKDCPYKEGVFPVQEFLGFLKSNDYKGYIVLEYRPEYRDRIKEDLGRLREFFKK